jgi:very-short-patch-repair endonuclease
MDLQTFNLPTNLIADTNIRIIMKDNEPWFVAKDIFEVLGKTSRSGNDLADLGDEDLDVFKTNPTNSQDSRLKKFNIISESGALKIIAKSRKLSGAKKELLIKALGLKTDTLVLKSNKEAEFGEMLIDTLSTFKPELQIVTQYVVSDYQLDFYIPEANLVIEFDETAHKYRKQQDIVRENKLKAVLDCKIIRVNEDDNLSKAIGNILREVMLNEVK